MTEVRLAQAPPGEAYTAEVLAYSLLKKKTP